MTAPLHVVLAGPVAGEDIRAFLADPAAPLPTGYTGAPLTGVLVGELLRLGHRVTAITTDTTLALDRPPASVDGERFRFVVCPSRPRAWRPNGWLPGRAVDAFGRERRLVASQIALARPDVVHAHWSYEFALAALSQPFAHLVTCHDSPAKVWRYTRSPYRLVRWLMARQALRRARHVTAVSDYMADEIRGMTRAPVQVVPNPVAPRVFALGRERASPVRAEVAMVCNGWGRLKNAQAALLAWPAVRQRLPAAALHLYGADFQPGGHAEAWAAAHGIDGGLHFHGPLPHADLLQALAGHDLLLHPALEESFGVVLAEAMGLGLPVVAGQASGAAPWVAGPQQWLVDVSRPDAIAAALADALSLPQRYAAASQAGRRRALAFSPEAVTTAYLARYREAIADSVCAARPWPATSTRLQDPR